MTQDTALTILKTGGNVFLTGEPGAGKTFVINSYVAWLEACGVPVAVTASTGIAATHIGGMTIHAWSGVGARDGLTPQELDQIISREVVVKRVRKAKVLIIDEVSMLDARLLEMVDMVTKGIRQSSEAFGGLQVVFVGDFFQLPPITKPGEEMRYAFESRVWHLAQPLVCYLSDQWRQEDELFLGLLQSIRRNDVNEEMFTLLQEQTDISYETVDPTRLFTHNADVDTLNTSKLKELPGSARRYTMRGKGNKLMLQALEKSCLSPGQLELKNDAMVMCTKNNFEAGYVNGTLGRVVDFGVEGFPVIETTSGKTIKIEPVSWSITEDKKTLAEITQIPLRLAWAITVHKSQGMSLDAAEIDLSKAFVYGQGYVALSRVRTLGGLKVTGMNPYALQVDPKIVVADGAFQIRSTEAEAAFAEMDEAEVVKLHQQFVTAVGGQYVAVVEPGASDGYERIKKLSTFEETKVMLGQGKTIVEIAKARGVTTSTIWGHVERLVADAAIDLSSVRHLTQQPQWNALYPAIKKAMLKHGVEKLKPLYEAMGGQYDYDVIRLARIMFALETKK